MPKYLANASIGRRSLLTACGSLLAAPAVVRAQGQGGVALVIGNSKYRSEATLPNVRRDAPDIARTFQAFGLQTQLLQELGRDAMRQAIDNFLSLATGKSFAVFYFAGHGVFDKITHLVPVDASFDTIALKDLIAVPPIRSGLATAAHNLAAFDVCRNSPFEGARQVSASDQSGGYQLLGSNPADPSNICMLFSTAPGRAALDGPAGENSPFAAALLRQFDGPSVELRALPANLRRDLLIATQGRQFLMDQSSYREAFVLNRPARNTAPAASKSAPGIDSSRLVEFPNAYAFAQQSGLLLPPGLVAVRPPVPSAHSAKIGAFKFTRGTEPGILVVLSVEEWPAVELFFVSRIVGTGRPFWNFVRGTLQNNTLEVFPTSLAAQHIFRWSDGNAGDLTIMPRQHTTSDRILASRFTRLD